MVCLLLGLHPAVLRPGAAHGYCVGLLTPASLAGDCREPMRRAQHLPNWRGHVRYAVPSLARGKWWLSWTIHLGIQDTDCCRAALKEHAQILGGYHVLGQHNLTARNLEPVMHPP